MANELRKYPKWDSAVGNSFLGGFYNVAPWPVGSKKMAAQYLQEGADIAPTRRNLCVIWPIPRGLPVKLGIRPITPIFRSQLRILTAIAAPPAP
jgi:hypothetical protein